MPVKATVHDALNVMATSAVRMIYSYLCVENIFLMYTKFHFQTDKAPCYREVALFAAQNSSVTEIFERLFSSLFKSPLSNSSAAIISLREN